MDRNRKRNSTDRTHRRPWRRCCCGVARLAIPLILLATAGCTTSGVTGFAPGLRQRILAPAALVAMRPSPAFPPGNAPPPFQPPGNAPQQGASPPGNNRPEPLPPPAPPQLAPGAAPPASPPIPGVAQSGQDARPPGVPAAPTVRSAEPVMAVPAEPRPLLLDQAIDMAWRFNPRLDALRERIAAAEGGRQIAAADFLPEATSTYRHLNGAPGTVPFVLPTIPNYVGNLAPGPPSDRFDRAELSVQWILWDFGRTSGKVGQAVSAVDIARLQFERARQTVAFDVTAAYFGVLAAQANARIAEEAVARADSVLRDARNFFQRGAAIRNDVLRADVLRAEMQLNLVKARTSTAAAVAALNQSIGINVSCPTQVVDQADELPFRLSLADCLQLAADNRDEFRVVLNAIRSSRLGVGVAQAEFLPRVLVGGVGLLQQTRNGEDVHLAAGGVNLEMALFEGGRRVGKLRSAEADVRVAIAQGKDLCDRIAYEVNLAFLGIQDARQRIDLSRTTVAQANENLRVVRRLVEQGDATSTDLIDAVLSITRAQQNYASALYDYQTSLARLTYATGLPNTPGLSSSLFASRT